MYKSKRIAKKATTSKRIVKRARANAMTHSKAKAMADAKAYKPKSDKAKSKAKPKTQSAYAKSQATSKTRDIKNKAVMTLAEKAASTKRKTKASSATTVKPKSRAKQRIAKKVRAGAPGAPTKRTATGKQRRMTGKEYAASRKQEFDAKMKNKKDASAAKGRKEAAERYRKFLQAKADTKKYGSARTTRLGQLRHRNELAGNGSYKKNREAAAASARRRPSKNTKPKRRGRPTLGSIGRKRSS